MEYIGLIPQSLAPICSVLVDRQSCTRREVVTLEVGSLVWNGARKAYGNRWIPGVEKSASTSKICIDAEKLRAGMFQTFSAFHTVFTYILMDSFMIAFKSLSACSSAMDKLSISLN